MDDLRRKELMQDDDYWCGVRCPTRWLDSFLNLSICILIEAATKAEPRQLCSKSAKRKKKPTTATR